MQMNVVLSFKGDCEEAFKFYEQHLGGQAGTIFRYGGSPLEHSVPADWSDKVMHGSVTVGGHVLMGGDFFGARYEEPRGVSLSLQMKNPADAERIFDALAKGGKVMMPLEQTFWAVRFGMVVDRFGISWLINCEEADQSASAS